LIVPFFMRTSADYQLTVTGSGTPGQADRSKTRRHPFEVLLELHRLDALSGSRNLAHYNFVRKVLEALTTIRIRLDTAKMVLLTSVMRHLLRLCATYFGYARNIKCLAMSNSVTRVLNSAQ
jgi:hypothetical protein